MSKGEGEKSGPEGPKGIGLGYVVYQQVAGVIGAFALVAFLSHFFDIGWRGVLADLVGMWDTYVRPAVKLLFDVTVVAFLKWAFSWRIEVPTTIRDYIAAGIVMALSYTRGILYVIMTYGFQRFWHNVGETAMGSFLLCVILWPYAIARIIMTTVRVAIEKNAPVMPHILMLSPMLYLALLLAANYLLLKPGP